MRQSTRIFSARWNGLAVLCLFLCACVREAAPDRASASEGFDRDSGNKVVLTINSASYSLENFQRYLDLAVDEGRDSLSPEVLSRFFDSFVEEKLLLAEARNRALILTADEKRIFLARLNRQMGGEGPDPSAEIPTSDLLLEKLLVEKLSVGLTAELAVAPEEITAYYQENKREFLRSEMVRVSQILLDSEDQAVRVYEQVKSGSEEDFRETARRMSRGAEAAKGGAMGVFELGQLPLEMEKVIFALKPGEASRVFESSYGYHIFRLDEKLAAELIDRDQAASRIELNLLEKKIAQRLEGFIGELKDRFEWAVHPENLPFPYDKD
jgi:hypothetical protein